MRKDMYVTTPEQMYSKNLNIDIIDEQVHYGVIYFSSLLHEYHS